MEAIRAKPFAAGWERILPNEKRAEKKAAGAPRKGLRPTPIRISKLTRNVLVLVALIVVAYVMWAVPAAPIAIIGGFALALVLSFSVRGLSYLMPRGLAIFVSFMILAGLILVALLVVVPLLLQQLLALANALPGLIANAEPLEKSWRPLILTYRRFPRARPRRSPRTRGGSSTAAATIASSSNTIRRDSTNRAGVLRGPGLYNDLSRAFPILFRAAFTLPRPATRCYRSGCSDRFTGSNEATRVNGR